jgi:ATP-dependent helicase/nuclease subunit B
MPSQPPHLAPAELFARLAAGHAARLSVVTPNRRLAQSLQRAFDRAQAARGRTSWESVDVLPFDAFVERLWDDALYSDIAPPVPLLLAPAQEQALWEEAVASSALGSALLAGPAAAAQCREAWRLAHAWGLAASMARDAASEDARAFVDWAGRYERLTRERGFTDAARLPEVVARCLDHPRVRKPATLVLFGFDLLTPQQETLLEALRARGVAILSSRSPARTAVASRCDFASAEEELAAAARWARSRLELDPQARIGLVVPDLPSSRLRVRRALARVLQPGSLLDAPGAAAPFDLSLGAPLDEAPLVHAALGLLRLCGRALPFEEASRLLRSPFIAAAEAEMAARARFDAAIRRRAGVEATLDQLLGLGAGPGMPRAPLLQERLARLAEHRRAALFGTKGAGAWARSFSEALAIAGFPGERALDSAEFQVLAKWHEVLAAFAALERVTGKMGFNEAVARLARIARDTLFQVEAAAEVPIQVLGILESAGLELDHLWICGMTDEAWPLPARPVALLSVRAQREAGVPQADPASSLALDRRITQGWLGSASEVVVSHARMREDSELRASPLVAALPRRTAAELEVPAYPSLRDVLHGAGTLERLEDARAPRLQAGAFAGGTSLFRDQAACPFRAFARHRVHSARVETPQPGLDVRDRGTLLHEMMRAVWSRLGTRAALQALAPAELASLLQACAEEAIARVRRYRHDALSGRFAVLERERLARTAHAWLELERARGDFDVVATEEKRPVSFGGVTVNAKLDRMDRLAQGGHAVIDYKSGAASVASWLGPRPDEPQVPMYALVGEDVRAVAFARVKPGEMEFCGLAMEEGLLPRVGSIDRNKSRHAGAYASWSALTAGWRRELEALGAGFLAGDARVDPKRVETACGQCEQHAFCRIAEKTPLAIAPGAAEPVE